ncbi:hypothetical protein RRG08_000232 [Elysia crispata]|uniref:Uncharacterized protein n=1 Tax=Elysia crispata TaxID=231223 RepID=A0AAE1E5Q9_9GAST|nr:hypothetical protein RRG08_000232 [Elysia crispata]
MNRSSGRDWGNGLRGKGTTPVVSPSGVSPGIDINPTHGGRGNSFVDEMSNPQNHSETIAPRLINNNTASLCSGVVHQGFRGLPLPKSKVDNLLQLDLSAGKCNEFATDLLSLIASRIHCQDPNETPKGPPLEGVERLPPSLRGRFILLCEMSNPPQRGVETPAEELRDVKLNPFGGFGATLNRFGINNKQPIPRRIPARRGERKRRTDLGATLRGNTAGATISNLKFPPKERIH